MSKELKNDRAVQLLAELEAAHNEQVEQIRKHERAMTTTVLVVASSIAIALLWKIFG